MPKPINNGVIEQLKKARDERMIALYQEDIKRKRAMDAAAKQDAAEKKSYMINADTGEKVKYWDQVKIDARKAINSTAYAYNDWRACMLSLISRYTTLALAIASSMQSVRIGIEEMFNNFVSNKIEDKIKKDSIKKSEFIIPQLAHTLTLSDNRRDLIASVELEGLSSLDVKPVDPKTSEEKKLFEQFEVKEAIETMFIEGVELWLTDKLGYSKEEDGTYRKAGVTLDDQDLQDLKIHGHPSLTEFLNEQFGVHFEEKRSYGLPR